MIEPITETAALGLIQRDAAMISLIAHVQTPMMRLAILTQSEKDAVLALVAVGQAMAVYAQADRPDAEVMASFDNVLATLSPAMARRIASIRTVAPAGARATVGITGLAHNLKALLAALALPANGPVAGR